MSLHEQFRRLTRETDVIGHTGRYLASGSIENFEANLGDIHSNLELILFEAIWINNQEAINMLIDRFFPQKWLDHAVFVSTERENFDVFKGLIKNGGQLTEDAYSNILSSKDSIKWLKRVKKLPDSLPDSFVLTTETKRYLEDRGVDIQKQLLGKKTTLQGNKLYVRTESDSESGSESS